MTAILYKVVALELAYLTVGFHQDCGMLDGLLPSRSPSPFILGQNER